MENHKPNPLKVTPMNAIKSKCHECMGHYVDGRVDCGNTACSLYAYMPYAQGEPNNEWTKYSNNRSGLVERMSRILSEEEKDVIRERLARTRNNKK